MCMYCITGSVHVCLTYNYTDCNKKTFYLSEAIMILYSTLVLYSMCQMQLRWVDVTWLYNGRLSAFCMLWKHIAWMSLYKPGCLLKTSRMKYPRLTVSWSSWEAAIPQHQRRMRANSSNLHLLPLLRLKTTDRHRAAVGVDANFVLARASVRCAIHNCAFCAK